VRAAEFYMIWAVRTTLTKRKMRSECRLRALTSRFTGAGRGFEVGF
jgi:hypothetical protein